MNKKTLIPVFAIALSGVTFFGVSRIYAEDKTEHPFVSKLAQKLGIEESKVLSAFNDIKTERHTEMQARLEERLTQSVKNGKLTETQKQAILAKHLELQKERENKKEAFKDMTKDQKKSEMKGKRDELKKWLDANGIDIKEFFGPMSGHKGMMWKMKAMN